MLSAMASPAYAVGTVPTLVLLDAQLNVLNRYAHTALSADPQCKEFPWPCPPPGPVCFLSNDVCHICFNTYIENLKTNLSDILNWGAEHRAAKQLAVRGGAHRLPRRGRERRLRLTARAVGRPLLLRQRLKGIRCTPNPYVHIDGMSGKLTHVLFRCAWRYACHPQRAKRRLRACGLTYKFLVLFHNGNNSVVLLETHCVAQISARWRWRRPTRPSTSAPPSTPARPTSVPTAATSAARRTARAASGTGAVWYALVCVCVHARARAFVSLTCAYVSCAGM